MAHPMGKAKRGPASASRPCLQSRQLHAHAGASAVNRALVDDHAKGEDGQDRREDGQRWPLCHVQKGGGRRVGTNVRADPIADHAVACAAFAGLAQTVVSKGSNPGAPITCPRYAHGGSEKLFPRYKPYPRLERHGANQDWLGNKAFSRSKMRSVSAAM